MNPVNISGTPAPACRQRTCAQAAAMASQARQQDWRMYPGLAVHSPSAAQAEQRLSTSMQSPLHIRAELSVLECLRCLHGLMRACGTWAHTATSHSAVQLRVASKSKSKSKRMMREMSGAQSGHLRVAPLRLGLLDVAAKHAHVYPLRRAPLLALRDRAAAVQTALIQLAIRLQAACACAASVSAAGTTSCTVDWQESLCTIRLGCPEL